MKTGEELRKIGEKRKRLMFDVSLSVIGVTLPLYRDHHQKKHLSLSSGIQFIPSSSSYNRWSRTDWGELMS
jgi:hypothetical protein